MNRLARLIYLLEHLEDYLELEQGRGWGVPGPGPTRKQDCAKCKGIGKLSSGNPCRHCWEGTGLKHRCETCPACRGKRKVWTDSYTSKVVEAPERQDFKSDAGLKRTCEACQGANGACPRCAGTGQVGKQRGAKAKKGKSAGQDMSYVIDGVMRRRELRNKSTSSEDVERGLKLLYIEDEIGCYLVKARYVEDRWATAPSGATAMALARGLLRLLDILEDSKLRVPARLLVKEMERDGKSINATSKELGIRKSKVRRARAA